MLGVVKSSYVKKQKKTEVLPYHKENCLSASKHPRIELKKPDFVGPYQKAGNTGERQKVAIIFVGYRECLL